MLLELTCASVICAGVVAYASRRLVNWDLVKSSVVATREIYFPSKSGFSTTGGTAKIEYKRCGATYSVRVPYRRELVSKMAGSQVWCQRGADRIEITQQPGIPYQVTAQMLGGDYIVVRKAGTERIFRQDEVPSF